MRGSWIAAGCAGLALVGSLAWLAGRGAPSAAVPPLAARAGDPGAEGTAPAVREPSALTSDAESPRTSIPAEVALAAATSSTVVVDRGTLIVTVLAKEDGAPLEGIWVLLGPEPPDKDLVPFSTSPQRSNRWITDASGRIEASVPAERKVRLMTRSERALEESLSIEPLAVGATRTVELRLATRPDLHFVARIVADEDGSPLPEARVVVADAKRLAAYRTGMMAMFSKKRRGTSAAASDPTDVAVDSDGFFEVDGWSWKDLAARVEASGFATQLVPITAGHETRAAALEVRLARAATLDARALDAAEAPLQDVLIQLVARAHQIVAPTQATLGLTYSMELVTWEARTGPDGRARIEGLPPRVALGVHATPPHGGKQILSEEIVLEPGEVRSLDLAIRSQGVVAGWLRKQDDSPVPDAEIWLKPRGELRYIAFEEHEGNQVRKARTDAQGRFEFKKVTDGAWIVGSAPSTSRPPSVTEVVVQEGATEGDVLLTAYDELYVRGVVLDPDGRPCAARVVARFGEPTGPVTTKSDAQGAFAVGPLAPGSYELVASAGYKADNLLANSLPLTVTAGDSSVTLKLRSGCSVAGQVVDAAKRAAVQADVTISQVGGDLALMASTSKSGTFQFGALEPGVYDLVAITPGGGCAVRAGMRLEAGQRTDALELAVEPGGRLRVHYDGSAESATIRIEHDGVCIVWGSVSRGASRDWFVPAGTNVVHCTSETSQADTREVQATTGKLVEVRF
jgi:Carboxypeptidase regulatory-like domain